MHIWKRLGNLDEVKLDELNERHQNTLAEHLGIKIVGIKEKSLIASMPVDSRTHQPRGILHGGASVVLAESVGSYAANLVLDEDHYAVGLDINANHLKMVRSGDVFGSATPVHLGRSTQVWQIKIENDQGDLVCISRLTMAVLERK